MIFEIVTNICNTAFSVSCPKCGNKFSHNVFSTARKPDSFVWVRCPKCGNKNTMKETTSLKQSLKQEISVMEVSDIELGIK